LLLFMTLRDFLLSAFFAQVKELILRVFQQI